MSITQSLIAEFQGRLFRKGLKAKIVLVVLLMYETALLNVQVLNKISIMEAYLNMMRNGCRPADLRDALWW